MTSEELRAAGGTEPLSDPPAERRPAARSASRAAGPVVRPRDLGVAGAYAVLAVLAQLLLPFEPATQVMGITVPVWTGLALQLLACSGLLVRTTRPPVVLAVTAPAAAASVALDAGPVSALLLFEAVFTAVRHGSPRLHRLTSILCLGLTAAILLGALSFPDLRTAWTQLLINVAVVLILPLLWAGEVRSHQQTPDPGRASGGRRAGVGRPAARARADPRCACRSSARTWPRTCTTASPGICRPWRCRPARCARVRPCAGIPRR